MTQIDLDVLDVPVGPPDAEDLVSAAMEWHFNPPHRALDRARQVDEAVRGAAGDAKTLAGRDSAVTDLGDGSAALRPFLRLLFR
ncbi:hypothetical protein ACWDU3_28510 [Streptomyces olivaceus]